MKADFKKILYINLARGDYEIKVHKNLNEFLGGIGLGAALCLENRDLEPLVLSIGPLSGIFPYASKTCACYIDLNGKFHESYGGGSFALVMKTSGFDAIVFLRRSKKKIGVKLLDYKAEIEVIDTVKKKKAFVQEGLIGKRSVLEFTGKTVIDGYFSFGDKSLSEAASLKNLEVLVISGNQSFKIENMDYYEKIYLDLLSCADSLTVGFDKRRSCGGCPMGCKFSRFGEKGANVGILARCLISCSFAESLYKDVPRVFSCLSSLGYHYTHDDLEDIPKKVGDLKNEL